VWQLLGEPADFLGLLNIESKRILWVGVDAVQVV